MDPTLQVIGVVIDYAALSRDVDGLIEAFAAPTWTELEQMKQVWRQRGFSFIFGARPEKLEPAQFMQILYSNIAAYLSPNYSLPWRLGAVYALHILYEIQEFNPRIKIYFSLENLKSLVSLVKELKQWPDRTPMKIIKRLVKENALLYGHTSVTHKDVEESARRRVKQIEERVQAASSKLFSKVPVREHLLGSLGTGLVDMKAPNLVREYSQAKERILQHINNHAEHQNEITVLKDIEQACKGQEEFRARVLSETAARQAEARAEKEMIDTIYNFDFEDLNFDDDQLDFLLGS